MECGQIQPVGQDVSNKYKYKSLLSEGAWIAGGQLVRALGTLLGIRLLTAYVTPSIYGTFSLLNGAVGLGASIFCTPYLSAAIRFYHEAEFPIGSTALRAEIRRLLFPSTAALATIIIVCGAFLFGYGYTTALSTTLFMAMLLCVGTLSAFETSFLTAARKQKCFSLWVAVEAWLKPLAALVLILIWQSSVNAILLGHIIGTILILILFFRPAEGLQAALSIQFKSGDRHLMRRIISFSMPLFPLPILGWISAAGDRYIIGGLLDLKAVGVFVASYGIVFQPFMIMGNIIELTVRPIYYQMASNNDKIRQRRAFKVWLGTTSAVCAVGVVGIFFLHRQIAVLLLGAQYRYASTLMPWIAMGGAMLAVTQVLQKPFLADMQTRGLLYIELFGAVASPVCAFAMIMAFGLKGAAMAVPMHYGIQLGAACTLIMKKNRVSY